MMPTKTCGGLLCARFVVLGSAMVLAEADAVVEKDGTVIGLVQNNTPLKPAFGTKEARYDATIFNWVGAPSFEE